ncbi:MAG: regulatory protein RecX [Lachnospiraceae bacterium]|nr:regulatory protein RecX [Lachnospiraceae bacterium]
MLVISIKEINKQRERILLDTEESFVLYRSEIRTLKIKEDCELSQENYDKIVKGILPKRCKMRAMNLLKERNYTVYQLKKKLMDGGYPEYIVNDTIDYVSSFGYVDDLKYAMAYIGEKESSYSRSEIKQKLLSKGISGRVTEEAYSKLGLEREEYGEEDSSGIEYELILKTLKKKGYSADLDYESKQKVLAYFYRRGFDMDIVRKAMEETVSGI